MNFLNGYKTIISIIVSLILKILATKGWISGDIETDMVVEKLMLLISVVMDFAAIFFRAKSKAPGPLA